MPTYPSADTPLSQTVPVTTSIVQPIPTPTYGTAGSWTILTKTSISSPHKAIDGFNLIRNTKTWKEWNTFTPVATFTSSNLSTSEQDGILEEGTLFSLDVYLNGDGLREDGKRSVVQPEKIAVIEEIVNGQGNRTGFVGASGHGRNGWRITWIANSMPKWLLWSERVLDFVEFEEEGKRGFEFINW
jgi:hypothetical protein